MHVYNLSNMKLNSNSLIALAALATVPFVVGAQTLTSPLKPAYQTVPNFLLALVDMIMLVGVPTIVIFIIYSGYLFVTAHGNESKLSSAKSTLLWVVMGSAVLLGSKVLATILQGTITSL